jgi:hypothetical protein
MERLAYLTERPVERARLAKDREMWYQPPDKPEPTHRGMGEEGAS